jgi:cytochrome c55X
MKLSVIGRAWVARLLYLSLVLLPVIASADPGELRRTQLLHLLKHDCGSCHGMTMKGGLGPPLLPASLAGKDTDYLVQVILEGRKGTAMPPWKNLLSKEEAYWLVNTMRKGSVDD